eukprot:TRINITY_DN27474_c0_g1_i1.p1 TRINITY_DN27474_c0_g1~~TRINITY_DN27474_c0_g1_i1.p1  ORF type:complete len:619 (-),score=122.18 TRINITY_DN27474_c0_g1_i1:126-1982(-)
MTVGGGDWLSNNDDVVREVFDRQVSLAKSIEDFRSQYLEDLQEQLDNFGSSLRKDLLALWGLPHAGTPSNGCRLETPNGHKTADQEVCFPGEIQCADMNSMSTDVIAELDILRERARLSEPQPGSSRFGEDDLKCRRPTVVTIACTNDMDDEDEDIPVSRGRRPSLILRPGGRSVRTRGGSDYSRNTMLSRATVKSRNVGRRSGVSAAPPRCTAQSIAMAEQLRKAQTDLLAPEATTWQEWFAANVSSNAFDYLMGLVVALNAVFIGVQVEVQSRGLEESVVFEIISGLFAFVFLAELVARLAAFGSLFFLGNDWRRNMFDLVLVVLMFVDLIVKAVASASDGMLETLSMLRLGRVLRLVRLVRLIPALKQLVYLILGSMASFCWTAVLMLIMMYCFALFLTDQATEFTLRSDLDVEVQTIVLGHWGSVGSSIQTLFMAMTGGDDWKNFIEHIGSTSMFTTIVFYCYVTFATMVMLNLVTGVFVDGAQRIIKDDKETDLIMLAAKAFAIIDTDMSGDISLTEFELHLNDDLLHKYCEAVGMDAEQALDLFRLLDADSSGTLSVTEFVEGCLRLRGPARSLDLAAVAVNLREHVASYQDDHARLIAEIESIKRAVTAKS